MLYLITHAYFMSYHAATTPVLRKYWTSMKPGALRWIGGVFLVLALAYFTAFMEAFTIQSVPYYHIEDRFTFYTIGSTFYMLYFVISFPMFARVEETGDKWSLARTAIDSLGSAMIVFCLCDFWRLIVGGLGSIDSSKMPFVY
eukprot:TRINITY_DN2760_c0_g1_i1.p1 TRINITY_DN2760_c0_g1~~TRINITY_DN2760_c0_g1_i1.p1  ORF type:complete len:143 (+),score=16.91 TRINITY_DN2760_c0_g1_i1:232-660(+)